MIRNGRISAGRTGRLIRLTLLLALMLCAGGAAAFAAAGSFYATTAVSAGDVVVWDPTADFGIKTTDVEGGQAVAGVTDESVGAGAACIVRQDGGRVAVNVTGAVARGQWLITSTTAGKARGVDDLQEGVFARALTDGGVPGPGRCYASVNLGFLSSHGGYSMGHSELSDLNWLSAGHTFDTDLDIGAHNFETSGQFTDGTSGITAAQGKTAYEHTQTTTDAHGLTYSAEGAGGGLDADTVDGAHAAGFAPSAHQHTESQITDLEHDALKIKGKAVDDSGLADGKIWKYEAATQTWKISEDAGASGSGAPTGATYITRTSDPMLTAEQALAELSSGLLKNTTGAGTLSIAAAGVDYSAPGHTHAEYEVAAENNDSAMVPAISSINVNGEDLKFTNPGGGQVNLELGTTYGEVSGGTRTISVSASSGSDANSGTSAAPLATIQKAWDVLPAILQEPTVIDIAAGTYAESLTLAGKQMGSAAASITVQGALVNSDSGTAAVATAITLSDTTKSWGINEYQYKLIRITAGTGSGQHAWIESNIANQVTIAGQWNIVPDATSAYSIDEPGAIINGGAGSISVYVNNIQNLTLKYLKGSACSIFVKVDNKTEILFTACEAAGAGVTGSGFNIDGNSYVRSGAEALFANDIGGLGFSINGQSCCVLVMRAYMRSCGSLGMQIAQKSFCYLLRSKTDGNTSYGIRVVDSSTLKTATGNSSSFIHNETVGIRAENMSGAWSVSGQNYSGCGTNYSPAGEGNNNSFGS